MDQVKIGGFIAELRKEQGLTQKQLAENIGVSDKTISKWECGNGLPEMSSIPVLCEALGINMNELLSGERLAEESYSKKAEENMMTLMKETAEQKRKNRSAVVTLILSLLGVAAAMILANFFNFATEQGSMWAFFDMGTLSMMVVPTIIIVAASGKGKAFFRAFRMLGKDSSYTDCQKEEAGRAVKLVANTMLVTGLLTTVQAMVFLFAYVNQGDASSVLLANVSVAMLGVLYGLAFWLLLLPLRSRLEGQFEA